MIKIALAGNPNCGKTMLFNILTGSNQYVGNWAGVTVEAKEGRLKGEKDVVIADLPGIYSLSPYTPEEVVARNYLIEQEPDVILNIIDGTNLERNLYLTTQLCEIGIPVILAVNMMDLVRKNGDCIHLDAIESRFGAPAFEISALKGVGIQKCVETVVETARQRNRDSRFAVVHCFEPPVEAALQKIQLKLPSGTDRTHLRYYATKIFERDELVAKHFPDCSAIIEQTERLYNDDSESMIADQRYRYITDCIDDCRTKSGRKSVTEKIDSIVTNRFLALPIFALIMFGVYFISVSAVGGALSDWVNQTVFGDNGIPLLVTGALNSMHCAPWLTSLITDGILAGVGAVLGFVPQIFVLFIFLSFLEDCGYMSRIAFILDRLFHRFGLSGKSFIPMLVGTGCGVPGIMASRTIENESDRRMTVVTTTFIPCGAKLPVIALIASSFFDGAWWVAPSAYLAGICAIVCSGIILKKTRLFQSEDTPFVMELPGYHLPSVRSVAKATWDRCWSYIKKAGTVILLASILVWFLSGYGFINGRLAATDMDESILAFLGRAVDKVFEPLGFGTWQAAVATILGLLAKEEIVGVFGVLYTDFSAAFTPLEGYSFLMFNLLCMPCMAAVGAIRREMNSAGWSLFAVAYQTLFAYCASLCIYQFGLLLSSGVLSAGTICAFAVAGVFLVLLFRKPAQGAHAPATPPGSMR